MYKHISFLFIVAGMLFMANAPHVLAQTPSPTPTCQTVYGGGTNCSATGSLSINKTVKNPKTNSYSNNLFQDVYIFGTSENVTFKLTLTNTTTRNIGNIHILDTLPTNLDYVSSDGTFNNTNRTITLSVSNLAAKASADYIVKAKVNTQPLPGNLSVACLPNTVQAQTTSFFFFNHTQSQDTSIFCITNKSTTSHPNNQTSNVEPLNPTSNTQTRGGQKVYTPPTSGQSPATGPETATIALLPILFGLGKFLQKKATG